MPANECTSGISWQRGFSLTFALTGGGTRVGEGLRQRRVVAPATPGARKALSRRQLKTWFILAGNRRGAFSFTLALPLGISLVLALALSFEGSKGGRHCLNKCSR